MSIGFQACVDSDEVDETGNETGTDITPREKHEIVLPDSTENPQHIRSPVANRRYFSSTLVVVLEKRSPGAELRLDNIVLPLVRFQIVTVEDGSHYVTYKDPEGYSETIAFQVAAGETTVYDPAIIEKLPGFVDLPKAAASSVPIQMTIRNLDSKLTDPWIHTSGQPDFRSLNSLTDYLVAETEGMELSSKAEYLMDFVARWSLQGIPPGQPSSLDSDLFGFFQYWGYGNCLEFSETMATLATLVGWAPEDIRIVAIGGHIVLELFYENGWHLFDPLSQLTITDESGQVLPLTEIEGENANQILRYCDQLGLAEEFTELSYYSCYFSEPENNVSFEPNFKFETKPDFMLEKNDRVDFFSQGFGMFFCVDDTLCFPSVHYPPGPVSPDGGTGILTRDWQETAEGKTEIVELPYLLVGMNLLAEVEAPGNLRLSIALHGQNGVDRREVDKPLDSYNSMVDLSDLFDPTMQGMVHRVEVTILNGTVSLKRLKMKVFFQFASRTIPQITHESRRVFVEGTGRKVEVKFRVHDQAENIVNATLTAPNRNEKPFQVPNNASNFVRLHAIVLNADGLPAAGHRLQVVSDHEGEIEIISPLMTGAAAVAVPNQ